MIDQYLTFTVDKQNYGVQISAIREINRISEITKVPEAPAYVAGVMNLRGKVIPVVTLRLRMKLAETDVTKETCTIVVETKAGQVGVIVDSVSSVINLDKKDVDETPVPQGDENYIIGVGKLENGMVLLVDIEKCLGSELIFGGEAIAAEAA
ncbi:chemotaxis protein CheW [Bdellovibrio sp. HCB-162]|uniref:chemotaxis protein CheW n=1 Tax=Bdellovibrio sp. HCB-162 TaxID=3394234 RepID=UPI0039BC232A